MSSVWQRAIIGSVVAAVLLGSAACSAPSRYVVNPEVGYYNVDGEVTTQGVIAGRQIVGKVTSNDMGLDSEVGVTPQFWVEWEDWVAGLTSFYAGFSGDGTAQESLVVGGKPVIEPNTPIRSDLSLGYIAANGLYRILGPDDFVQLAAGLAIGAASYDVSLKGKGAAQGEVESSGTYPFGYLTARVWKQLGPVELLVGGQGIGVDLSEDKIQYYELYGSANYTIWGEPDTTEGRIVLGYRYLKFNYTEDDRNDQFKVRATIQGPFASFIINW